MNANEKKSDSNAVDTEGNRSKYGPRRHRGIGAVTLLLTGSLVGAGLVTAFGVSAHSQENGYFGMGGQSGMHGGSGMGGMYGGDGMGMEGGMHGGGKGGYMHGDRKGGMHGARMMGRVDYLLDEVEATPEQREKIGALLEDMFTQMRAMHENRGGARGEMMSALTAPEVDRAALEKLRAQHIGEMDARSKTMIDGMANMAEALTPEQRAQLAEYFRKHAPRH